MLRIGLWNTRGREARLLPRAKELVRRLLVDHDLDLLALVEVQPGRSPTPEEGPWRTIEVTRAEGRGRWDVAFAHRETLVLEQPSPVVRLWNGRALRLGVEVGGTHVRTGQRMRIVASHWPSWSAGDVSPQLYVEGLMRLVAPDDEPPVPTLLLGDYNIDPFEGWSAATTRDRALAARKRALFFNLAWRWLGTWNERGVAGTYRYAAVASTHWRTFDQMLVSTHLLGQGPITLAEGYVVDEVDSQSVLASGFDHVPVVATFHTGDTRREEL